MVCVYVAGFLIIYTFYMFLSYQRFAIINETPVCVPVAHPVIILNCSVRVHRKQMQAETQRQYRVAKLKAVARM